MLDLSTLAIQDSTILHLEHPSTQEKLYADEAGLEPITITVASRASKQYRAAVTAMRNRQLQRERKNEKETAKTQREEGIELLVACCLDSTNFVVDGKTVKTQEEFRQLLGNESLSWIKTQIDETLGSIEVFMKK